MGRAHHDDDQDLYPGRVLGPYELIMPVGSGGMARVWAARHRGAGAVFALKMLMPHLAENSAFRDMFFDEARIASRIHHENVARTFELVDLDGTLTIVMEWVDGSSLVRLLRPGTTEKENAPRVALPPREAARILAEACAGLHAAHELVGNDGRPLDVVHRDVSPHNILLTRRGLVKVTDFGVAKALGKSHMTIAGQVKGKLAYMSPEQLVGGGVDRRSDIFALGSVLYETTTGQRPFQGDHDPQVMAAIIMGSCQQPRAVVRGYPRGLEEIVMRALSVEPTARYATALELKEALERWLASSGPAVGRDEVARLLQERCAAELQERVGLLSITQLAVAIPESKGLPAEHASAESSRARPTPRTRRPADANSMSTLAAVLAVLVGLALGLGVLFFVRHARKERRATVIDTPTLDASAADSSSPDATPLADSPTTFAPTGVDEATTPYTDAATTAKVVLRAPEGARLFVDGKELPMGTLSIPRPDAGTVLVLVKAPGYKDTMVQLEPSSPDE
ncbi:MAG TPA: serine/threonine-protein kinase, partial [Labilithrix sp.]|nr:serine/threonine-protein kinase [Labilithrix sp.]